MKFSSEFAGKLLCWPTIASMQIVSSCNWSGDYEESGGVQSLESGGNRVHPFGSHTRLAI